MHHPPKKQPVRRKNRRLAILLVLLGAALAAAFVMCLPLIRTLFPSPRQMEIVTQVQRVFEITDPATLASLTITPENGSSYTLRMYNGALMLEDGGELLDINDAYERELLSVATQIVGQGVVAENAAEVEEHLADMGFAPPRASAVIRYADGTQSLLELGTAVPNTTYSYCRWSGSPAIYMCDAGVTDVLCLTRNRLLPVEQPQIDADLLVRLGLENVRDQLEIDFSDGAYGAMTAPVPYPLGREASAQLLTALGNFRLGTLEGEVTEENRAAYGFDEPLCVLEMTLKSGMVSGVDENGGLATYMRPETALRFVIGREEGEFFYTCEYEGRCYLVSRFLTEIFVNARKADLISRNPADVGDLPVHSISIRRDGKQASLLAVRTERVLPNNELELDNNGNIVYDTRVLLNGDESTAELLDVVVSRLDQLTASSDVPQNWSPDGEPRWSVVIRTETGLQRKVEAWKLDLFADVMMVDGVAMHCTYSEAIDMITEGLL